MSEREKSAADLIEEMRALGEHYAANANLELARPEPSYLDALANLRAMRIDLGPDGRFIEVSPTVRDILGYEPQELMELRDLSWVHPDDLEVLAQLTREVRLSGQTSRAVFRARHKTGEWRWLELATAEPYRTPAGDIHAVAFLRDVTLRMRAQEALVESEERYRALAENASDLIAEVDGSGRLLYVSPSCRHLLGREPEELLGRSLREISTPRSMKQEDRKQLLEVFGGDLEAEHAAEGVEWRFKHSDGSWRWFESKAKSFWRSGNAKGLVVISRDVTARVRAREALIEIEERYRLVAQASGDIVSEFDSEGRMVWVSPTCEDVLGWKPEQLIGTSPFTIVHGDEVEDSSERFLNSMATEEPIRGSRIRVKHRDASWHWLEITGRPFQNADGELRYLSVARDVTERVREEEERRRLEQRMVQAQKLEGLGIMAGGVAHDFNNLLTPILGHASLALLELPEDSPVRERLKGVQRAAHRAAALTNQMLSYTGIGPIQIAHVDLSDLVKEIGELIESAATGKVAIDFQLASAIPGADGDSSQLSQVVMNLITNAVESSDENEGRVVIRTGAPSEPLDESRISYGEVDPEQSYVFFEVEDDGCGMDAETRERIFDPFFSTKFTGRGLGLAAVLGIVRGHRGLIELDTEPDRGTRFRIFLPSAASKDLGPTFAASPEEPWSTEGVVLLADDDESVRELASDTLERCGLSVLHAEDGRQAVELFRKYPDDIRIVLLDRTMPVCSGSQALKEIREIRADAKIILISGYSHERALEDFGDQGLSGFVQKPFMPLALLNKVREALGE